MAFQIIVDTCTACGACEGECPNKAISHKGKIFKIDPKKCKECVGDFDAPQCAEVCQSGSCVKLEEAARRAPRRADAAPGPSGGDGKHGRL